MAKFLPQNTWWKATSTTRPSITEITFARSLPEGNITESWDASENQDGNLMCYIIENKLFIVSSEEIYANEDAMGMFSVEQYIDTKGFINVTAINNLNYLNTSLSTNLVDVFTGMAKITSIDVSSFDTSNATNISSMFSLCSSLISLDCSNFSTQNNTSLSYFCNECSSLTSIIFSSKFKTNKVKSFQACFSSCSSLTSLDLSNFDFSACEEFQMMFSGCENLISINFPTDCVIHLKSYYGKLFYENGYGEFPCGMFQNCKKLQNICSFELDPEMYYLGFMFYGCSSLGQIDVSTWDTSHIKSLDHFAAHANLKRIGMENWDVSSLENADACFHNCAEEELDLSKWNVSKVKFFGQMFENSSNLKSIKGLQNWNTSAGLGFEEMFARCPKLEELNLSSFNTTHAKNGERASANGSLTETLKEFIAETPSLQKITLGPNVSLNGDGTNTTEANKLTFPAGAQWYTINGEQTGPKDRTQETYWRDYDDIANLNVIVKNKVLIETAKAIREKNGSNDKYKPIEFANIIRNIKQEAFFLWQRRSSILGFL